MITLGAKMLFATCYQATFGGGSDRRNVFVFAVGHFAEKKKEARCQVERRVKG